MKLYGNKGKQNKAFKQPKTTTYPKVDNYKYLGISLNQKVMPEQHIEHLEKKLNQFRKMIRINRLQGAPTNKIMYLWMVFAESIISYGDFYSPSEISHKICGIDISRSIGKALFID